MEAKCKTLLNSCFIPAIWWSRFIHKIYDYTFNNTVPLGARKVHDWISNADEMVPHSSETVILYLEHILP